MKYTRAPRLLYRVAPDRVIVREVGGSAHELHGAAALTWAAADEPADVSTLAARVAEVHPAALGGGADVAGAVRELLADGLLVEVGE